MVILYNSLDAKMVITTNKISIWKPQENERTLCTLQPSELSSPQFVVFSIIAHSFVFFCVLCFWLGKPTILTTTYTVHHIILNSTEDLFFFMKLIQGTVKILNIEVKQSTPWQKKEKWTLSCYYRTANMKRAKCKWKTCSQISIFSLYRVKGTVLKADEHVDMLVIPQQLLLH